MTDQENNSAKAKKAELGQIRAMLYKQVNKQANTIRCQAAPFSRRREKDSQANLKVVECVTKHPNSYFLLFALLLLPHSCVSPRFLLYSLVI